MLGNAAPQYRAAKEQSGRTNLSRGWVVTQVKRTAPSLCSFVLALQRPHFIAVVKQI